MTTHASAYARGSRPNTRTSGCSSDWPTNSAPTARRTRCRASSAGLTSYRGFYAQVQYTILPDKLFGADILRGGKLSFQVECFDKGNYFRDHNDHTAIFGRVELAWEF